MPRRQSQSKSPSYNSRRYSSSVPAHVPSSPADSAPKGKQPGVFAHMAAVSGGMAVGSAVGHVVGRAVTGMVGGGGQAQSQVAPQQVQKYDEPTGPCAWEIKQFLECAANNSDINLCQGFNEAIKACKNKHNIE